MSEKCGISRDTGNFAAAAEKSQKKDNSRNKYVYINMSTYISTGHRGIRDKRNEIWVGTKKSRRHRERESISYHIALCFLALLFFLLFFTGVHINKKIKKNQQLTNKGSNTRSGLNIFHSYLVEHLY